MALQRYETRMELSHRVSGGCNPFRVGGFSFKFTQGSSEGFRGTPGLNDSIPSGLEVGFGYKPLVSKINLCFQSHTGKQAQRPGNR
jgi:hypothetical protein